jgi:hypothetical protein
MKSTNTILKQQSRQAVKIPTQPLMLTIGKGDMPHVPLMLPPVPHEIISIASRPMPANPVGWNGARWHDGAD